MRALRRVKPGEHAVEGAAAVGHELVAGALLDSLEGEANLVTPKELGEIGRQVYLKRALLALVDGRDGCAEETEEVGGKGPQIGRGNIGGGRRRPGANWFPR